MRTRQVNKFFAQSCRLLTDWLTMQLIDRVGARDAYASKNMKVRVEYFVKLYELDKSEYPVKTFQTFKFDESENLINQAIVGHVPFGVRRGVCVQPAWW